jgi:transposase
VLRAHRNQVELRACDLESLLEPQHPARAVWAFVQALDLKPLYARIRSVEGSAGAPAIDPAIVLALWLWATIDGVGSARELERLCERDDTYRWLCGGVGVNHHTLSDFRTGHGDWLDQQLTRSIAALMERKLVTLHVVAQDGLRVRAAAKASSFRRKERLQELHRQAQQQVQTLKQELQADAGASARRKQAAQERAAREREERLAQALQTLDDLERQAQQRAEDKAARRKEKSRRRGGEQVPCSSPDAALQTEAQAPEGEAQAPKDKIEAAPPTREWRVSTTDAQARVMKMADGGFRPAYNVQLAVDEATQLIAAVDVVTEGSDMHQMEPLHQLVVQRYGSTPTHWLADGGYPKHEAIEKLTRLGTQPIVPPTRGRTGASDPFKQKASDSPEVAQWRRVMASDEARELYKRRGASVECANAQFRRRGLYGFNVCGQRKARAVALWHALAHNFMRLRSLGIAVA